MAEKKIKVKSESKETEIPVKTEKKEPKKYPPKVERVVSFILLFKVKDHKTWRLQSYGEKADLDKYLALPGQKNFPTITDKKWFIFNRLTGEITPE